MWFTHEKMIRDVEKMLRRDFTDSDKVELGRGSQTVMMRFLSQAARLFSPIL